MNTEGPIAHEFSLLLLLLLLQIIIIIIIIVTNNTAYMAVQIQLM
jgi:uncharacterized protein (UPF0333 family)